MDKKEEAIWREKNEVCGLIDMLECYIDLTKEMAIHLSIISEELQDAKNYLKIRKKEIR
jgi:hypothetical protein